MAVLRISTPYGKDYTIDQAGRINGYSQWIMQGIRHVKATTRFVPLAKLFEPGFIDTLELRYRTSGNPQWTVQDLDHGTRRIWGNTRYHGIRWLWLET